MGNRPTEWTFAPGAIDIDVDPLSIACAGCELIDAILGDRHPVRDPQLTADELRNCHHAVVGNRHIRCRVHGIARKSLRRILPTFDFGSASRKRTSLGTLYAASSRRQCAITSVSVRAAPRACATNSLTASPVFSSGRPTQAHSTTPAQAAATASTSFGNTLKPETMIMSFLRSTILRK